MNTIKAIGIFLLVLLGIFILLGIYYGIILYFWVVKLMALAAIVGSVIIIYYKGKKSLKKDKNE